VKIKDAELKAIFDLAPQPTVLADAHLHIRAANQAALSLSGFSSAEIDGAPLAELLAPAEAMRLGAVCDRGPGPHFFVAQGRRLSGTEYRVELRLKRLSIDGNELWLATLADVTANFEALEALRRSEAEYRRMVEASPDGVAMVVEGCVVFANGAMERLLGLSGPDELWGAEFEGFVHPDDLDAWRLAEARLLQGLPVAPQEIRAVKPEGGIAELELARLSLERPEGAAQLVLARDAKSRKEIERRLKESEERYKGLADVAFDGVAVHLDGTILSVNRSFESIFGRAEGELLGADLFLLFNEDDQALFRAELDSGRVLELQGSQPNGDSVFVEASSRACMYENEPAYVTAVRDVTRRRQAEDSVRRQAWHDALTGLPNRVLLMDRLEQALRQAIREGRRLAVLFLDLDRFKLVNDSLGHAAGDDLLKQAAARLLDLLRKGDTVARMGGDEFCVLLSDAAFEGDALAVGQKIVTALHEPFMVMDQEVHIGTSVGVAFYPDHDSDPERLLKLADMAMYRAKKNGRDQVAVYTENLEGKQEQRLGLENDLRRAIEREEFKVFYQPQIELSTGRIIGAEALLRWQHPERGLLSPDEFIPLAEETRLIVPLGEWVLFTTCSKAAEWNKKAPAGMFLSIAVNLSAWQLHKHNLLKTVDAALAKSGLPADRLELEITETVAMRNPAMTLDMLRSFAQRGMRLSLDDFGKGYSSLQYLKDFPVHSIKVDKAFVDGVPHDRKDAAIVKAMIALAHNLQLRCLAEGIETQEQLDFLRREGCDHGQGYLYSRPVPEDAFEALLLAAPFGKHA
jgi:diguanylate cyclase (GGDEF)-like protein/PAS domain S-box-containing protein